MPSKPSHVGFLAVDYLLPKINEANGLGLTDLGLKVVVGGVCGNTEVKVVECHAILDKFIDDVPTKCEFRKCLL